MIVVSWGTLSPREIAAELCADVEDLYRHQSLSDDACLRAAAMAALLGSSLMLAIDPVVAQAEEVKGWVGRLDKFFPRGAPAPSEVS